MVSSCRTVISGASALTWRIPRSSGTSLATGSSSRRTPSSRSASTAAAVKLLVIDAMRNTVPASGAGPPSQRWPNPPVCTRAPPATIPYATPGAPPLRWKSATSSSAAADHGRRQVFIHTVTVLL